MPRVHVVQKSRKEYPGIPVGSKYYWWKFRYGGKRRSLVRPTRSQLTQSEYLGRVYELQDQDVPDDVESLETYIENLITDIEELGEEQQDRLDNMPEQLQESSMAGELLQSRMDNCENAVSTLENAKAEIEDYLDDVNDNPDDFNEDRELEIVTDAQDAIADALCDLE